MMTAHRLLVASPLLLAAVGCESKMHKDNVSLLEQNRTLQSQLDAANAQLRDSPDPAQFRTLQGQLLSRDQQIADLNNRPPTTVPVVVPGPAGAAASKPFGELETSVDANAGTITVTLPGDVLFASGSADLKASAQTSLDKVASVLKRDYAMKRVRVEGHTDADPIRKTKTDWADNLDLSLVRAAAVTRYLEEQGVSPKLVTTSGYGQYHPRSSVKANNRRVEIVVVMR